MFIGSTALARGACLLHCRADAVVGDEGFGIGEAGRDAGGGDGFAAVDARGDVEVEVGRHQFSTSSNRPFHGYH